MREYNIVTVNGGHIWGKFFGSFDYEEAVNAFFSIYTTTCGLTISLI